MGVARATARFLSTDGISKSLIGHIVKFPIYLDNKPMS